MCSYINLFYDLSDKMRGIPDDQYAQYGLEIIYINQFQQQFTQLKEQYNTKNFDALNKGQIQSHYEVNITYFSKLLNIEENTLYTKSKIQQYKNQILYIENIKKTIRNIIQCDLCGEKDTDSN